MIIALQTLIFFRESLLAVLDGLLRPYFKRFLTFSRQNESDDDESDDQVFAEFDDEKGVVFYPPMYAQRYAAVTDCLMDERWSGKLEKVVDLGYHDVSFIKYLKDIPGVKTILGVDLESLPLRCSSDLVIDYTPKRENPLQVTLFQGNAADPDYRLIGCDAVVAIEMIEHMLPHDLDRLVHTVFGFVKPWIAVFTTPNGDFNTLFKSLEKNGLRRLDHFFEWSREQFHDWCSNIVLRYPQYTVVCKGIGPGPPGTLHHGCCSQLALFIAKNYSKQQDLDLNSLALVANTKDPYRVSEIIGSVESCSDATEHHMLCLPPCDIDSNLGSPVDSISTLMASALTIMEPLEYTDKTSQCNLDSEVGKSFMFEDESCFNVMLPRKKIVNRVYDIEDVANRLNCSTLQVKKFSKTTQNLMAKNKMDSLVHTREVVDEIRHLTKMLNFNKEVNEKGDGLWRNYNWGDNAPYWNQFYKVVREYNYPFETKSEESRIVDLISEEISRLIDSQCDEEFNVDVNKIEIPISYLMKMVSHITDDVERVKDLLEWNGYEILDDVLIYSRLVAETASVTTREDWQEDTLSDFDTTDIHSTSLSEASTIAPDYTGRCLQRALDQKVRKLRSMLTADEDIATELDRVVCRLMKLALRNSRVRQHPPPTKWMQCKLFDLLSLTEKAIDRRRQRFIENFPLNALDYDDQVRSVDETLALAKIKNTDSVDLLVNKYQNLVECYETNEANRNNLNNDGFDFDEHLSDISNEFSRDYEFATSDAVIEPIPKSIPYDYYTKEVAESKLQRIQAWVDEDIEVVPYPKHDSRLISSGDTDHSATNIRYKLKKMSRKRKATMNAADKQHSKARKNSVPKICIDNPPKIKSSEKKKSNKGNFNKKATGKKSSYCVLVKANLFKTSSNSLANLKSKKMKDYLNSAKPIPATFKELQHPDLNAKKKLEENIEYLLNIGRMNDPVIEKETDVAATEESLLVNIVTEDLEETIALRRTIGTDAGEDPIEYERETVLGSLLNVMKNDSFCNKPDITTENVHSQTIFLNDINEPSTSKGVRHVSMDVQCGPDMTVSAFCTLSTTTSFTTCPKLINNGIKIGDSDFEFPVMSSDFKTCTGQNNCRCRPISPKTKSVGIIIKDSETNFNINRTVTCAPANDAKDNAPAKETELIKPITSGMKIVDSGSDCFESVGSYPKSHCASNAGYVSDITLKSSASKEGIFGPKYACIKYTRPKLSRGGVHVHSYKDMQESEDVMYQGHWQRCRPKVLTRKRVIFNTASVRKLSELTKKLRVNSKEKLQAPDKKEMKIEMKPLKPFQVRMPLKLKNELRTKKNQAPNNNTLNMTKGNNNVTKMPTKQTTSSLSTKKSKTLFVPRKLATIPPNETRKELAKKSKTQFVPRKLAAISPKETKKELEHVLNSKNKSTGAAVLKRTIMRPIKKNILNKSIDSVEEAIKETKSKPIGQVGALVRCKTEFIKKELLKFDDTLRDNISYVVLRNESENKSNAKNNALANAMSSSIHKSDSSNRRNISPSSQNSSTCSSLNSIATVRVVSNRSKLVATKRISSSSNQDNIAESPVRNKKYTKKNKIAKKGDVKDLDNKENIPQSSNGVKKEKERQIKNTNRSTSKNVYIAQVATEPSQQNALSNLSRHKTSTPKKLSVKNSKVDELIPASPSSLGKSSITSSPRKSPVKVSSSQKVLTSPKTTTQDSKVQLSRMRTSPTYSLSRVTDDSDNNIAMSLRKLIEERLNFIANSSDDSSIDSKTVILSRDNWPIFDETGSLDSYKTVINNEDYDTALLLQFDIETAVNRTFDSIVESKSNVADDEALTDTDMLSFKTTTVASRPSEYFLADNEFNNSQANFSEVNSVRDIFERRNQLIAQSEDGNLTSQVFSGFSINALAGDRPDPVALVDSETGSIALDTVRQASEEVFVSGRSSGSYESCLYDDDALIPHWLFHINNQFVDEEEEEDEPEDLQVPVELPEPVFDMNGNVVAVGTGAGDGRGMHSDHSQDSSGHGTSTTSSDPSSGVQSEAILIDPSAFTRQFELPVITVPADLPESSPHEAGENIEFLVPERSGRRNPVVQLLATSDMDADVSSLDTDVQDSP